MRRPCGRAYRSGSLRVPLPLAVFGRLELDRLRLVIGDALYDGDLVAVELGGPLPVIAVEAQPGHRLRRRVEWNDVVARGFDNHDARGLHLAVEEGENSVEVH